MEYSLLDNGVDSLQKAKEYIKKLEVVHEEFANHHMKDAIIFLNHGIEILLKFMLSSINESLIFDNLKAYMDARSELIKLRKSTPGSESFVVTKYNTVFDVKKGIDLKTITLVAALDRVKLLTSIELDDTFVSSVHNLNKLRNKITHHSISMTRAESRELYVQLKGTYKMALDLFEMHIPGVLEKVDSEVFELTTQEWEEHNRLMQEFVWERSMSRISIDDDYE